MRGKIESRRRGGGKEEREEGPKDRGKGGGKKGKVGGGSAEAADFRPSPHSEIPNAQPPGLGASVFLLLKPLLWNFVMVALRSKYNNRPEEATSGRCQDPVRTFRSSPLPTGTLQ